MSKPKNTDKEAVVSFRVAEEVNRKLKKEAKKRKQSKAEFVESVFMPALEAAVATSGK
jgi:hypothetical protein